MGGYLPHLVLGPSDGGVERLTVSFRSPGVTASTRDAARRAPLRGHRRGARAASQAL